MSMMRWLGCMAIAGALCVPAAQAQVQGVAGFSRARPIVRTASDAPTATIRQVRFNNNPQNPRLYSTGDDKIVRSFAIEPTSGGGFQLTPSTTFAWPIYRAVRGVIYALDVQTTPLGDRLVFGGLGSKTAWVDLLHVNRPDKAELHRHPEVDARDNVVNAVAFHPDGSQFAVAHNRSDIVLLWGLLPQKSTGKSSQLKTGLSQVMHLAYSPRGDRLALAGLNATSKQWEVQEWDTARLVVTHRQTIASEVTGLAWGNDSIWLASTHAGVAQRGENVSHNTGRVQAIVRPRGSAPYVIARFDESANQTRITTWDGSQKFTELPSSTFLGPDVAIDVSPDGRFIAAGGSVLDGGGLPAYAVRLWNAATLQPIAQFPDVNRRGTLGAPIANVGIVPGERVEGGGVTPYKIGFAWGPKPKGNLPAYQFQFDRVGRDKTAIAPHTGGLGREAQDRSVFTASLNGKPVVYLANTANPRQDPWLLPLWADRRPVCYTLNERLNLLALGYNDGVLLCDLANIKNPKFLDKDKAILRSFYGHEGAVTCLSLSADPPLLLTGSTDGTICAWKIDDVADPRRRPASELGLTFNFVPQAKGNFLTVLNDPVPGSVAAEAGFQKGQQVAEVSVAGPKLEFAKWKDYLNAPVPGKELNVVVVQGGRRHDLLSVVSHDALWTLYPQQDGNWLVWTQEGHFDAPLEALDRLSWHINLSTDESEAKLVSNGEVMSLSGRDFQELFHKPEVVDNGLLNLIPDKPREHFLPPGLEINVQGNVVTLTATPKGAEPLAEVELWLNGHRLARQQSAGSKQPITLPAQIPNGYRRADGNQLVAVAAIEVIDPQSKKPAKIYNRKRVQLPDAAAAPATVARKLHYAGIGVSTLDFKPPGLNSLEFPGHDAYELGEQLRASAALGAGYFETLADFKDCRKPTEANIQKLLQDLKTHVGPDDLAVVFFAGHGVNVAGKGFRFIAQDTKTAEGSTISDVAINDLLSQLPCRTILILDTCHAQGVTIERNLQDWPGIGLGPMILASCDFSKESFEDARLQLPGGAQGHGLFTAALLEGLLLDGRRAENRIKKELPQRDADKNGRLTIEEWCLYAQHRTAMLSNLAFSPFSRPGKEQYTPKLLLSFSFLDHKSFTFAGAK